MSCRLVVLALLLTGVLANICSAQKEGDRREHSKQEQMKAEQAPPEEDESLAKKEYSFNPLQAAKELRVGNFYFKKGNYRAAVQRFQEAAKWDPGYAEAYLRLGEALEKEKDAKAAREAFAKYLELAPDSKYAAIIKKKLQSPPR